MSTDDEHLADPADFFVSALAGEMVLAIVARAARGEATYEERRFVREWVLELVTRSTAASLVAEAEYLLGEEPES
jgi:hypothetical protein